jgi:hypothetical protein
MEQGLENNTKVARHTQISLRDKKFNPELVPKERCFTPNSNDQGLLSVDSLLIFSPEESLATRGAQYKHGTNDFKSIDDWEIYGLPVSEINLIDKTISVFADPILVVPPVKGKPDNRAHCLIGLTKINEQDLPEIVLKLRDIARKNPVSIERGLANDLVEKYRTQW